jgi:hypothetical protein
MGQIPGEIADALVAMLASPNVQAALLTAVTAGEVQLQSIVDKAIESASGSGILGVVIAASKGTVAAEMNAEFAKLPPEGIVAFITKLAQDEAKRLGG